MLVRLSLVASALALGCNGDGTVGTTPRADGGTGGRDAEAPSSDARPADRDAGPGGPIGECAAPAEPVMARSITRFGITWTFDREYSTGSFINGDPWVVGPVRIERIEPGFDGEGNGSVVNPEAGDAQGYHATADGWDESLLATAPLTLEPDDSLVSTIGLESYEGLWSHIDTAAVLTAVTEPPPADAFRPPYVGAAKPSRCRGELDTSLLPSLDPIDEVPDPEELAREIERPWLDHKRAWTGQQIHPVSNMPEYGRDLAAILGDVAVLLLVRVERETLLVRFVQLGIDYFHANLSSNDLWPADGGHGSGRKWPILFAGLLFHDAAMQAVEGDFGEDQQTFFVEETSPGVYNQGHGGYGPEHVGMPEWGFRHANDPSEDDARWDIDATPYRFCCTANAWSGYALAAHYLGATEIWRHDAFFAYMDRYAEMELDRPSGESWFAWSELSGAMWARYREGAP
jgi:hypothetical protein